MPERGLYEKYHVCDPVTGVLVEGCFVLRPHNDPAARQAMQKYSEVTENLTLSRELAQWLADLAVEDLFTHKTLWEALRVLRTTHLGTPNPEAATTRLWNSPEMLPILRALKQEAGRGER